eukprot:PhM_4_TR18847/c3_g1_i4/m.100367
MLPTRPRSFFSRFRDVPHLCPRWATSTTCVSCPTMPTTSSLPPRSLCCAAATINEVDVSVDDLDSFLRSLTVERGEFLGVDFDYVEKRTRVGSKALQKLALLKARLELEPGAFTYQNLLGLYGVLFFVQQVTQAPSASRYYAMRMYSKAARVVQGMLHTRWRGPPARLRHLMAWIEEVMANDWQQPVVPIAPREAAHVIVCDASAWGWGAQHLDRRTGFVYLVSRRWPDGYPGAKTSTWAESDGVAKALQHFFADGHQPACSC